ncbi:hypothetical protein ACFYS8_13265 [Kitasatospora sp. NPDC004615]|uniref:hypothetical protein n=1 Tax=unclassified Kitasatospora TaxID=2633591 RepID=UPI00369A54BF
MRTRPHFTSPGATAAQKAWNEGKTGTPKPRPAIPLTECCPVDGCGATMSPPPAAVTGWTYAEVAGSTDPGRWWCSGSCAAVGIARAELLVVAP